MQVKQPRRTVERIPAEPGNLRFHRPACDESTDMASDRHERALGGVTAAHRCLPPVRP